MATPPVLLEQTFNAQEIADRLGVAERTVRRWVESGRLPAERDGRTFSIRLADAERLVGASSTSRAARRTLALEDVAAAKDGELAELRGRYLELKERVERLETDLAEERRRSARLEVELELQVA